MFEIAIPAKAANSLSPASLARIRAARITGTATGVRADVKVFAGGFRGNVSGDLRADELRSYLTTITPQGDVSPW
jgi:hypothetical protein